MSEARRAYDILRGYIGREWNRISGVDEASAERELEEALASPRPSKRSDESGEYIVSTRLLTDEEKPAYARKLLGVGADAGFAEIRKKFERLNERSDPKKFAEGSIEREQAAIIQRRVVWAYQVLTEHLDGTEKRFRSLEID